MIIRATVTLNFEYDIEDGLVETLEDARQDVIEYLINGAVIDESDVSVEEVNV